MQIYYAKYLLIFSVILSLVTIPTIGIPQSSVAGTTYDQQDLPSNIRSYIDHIHFDPTSARGQGVQLFFKDVPPMSGKISEDIASFIVNSPVWHGSRNTYDIANEINVHWSMAEHGMDRPGETRPNAITPVHLEYNKNDQSHFQQGTFNLWGPVTGFIANTARLIDNKPIEENNKKGVESFSSSSVNNPWQGQGQSISNPWQNLNTGSSIIDQSKSTSTGRTTNPPVDQKPIAALDSVLIGAPQSPVTWLETSPTDTLKTNTQGTTQTTSKSTDAKFSIGDKVEVTTPLGLHVRSVPGDLTNDPAIPLEPMGSLGTIQKGSRVYKNGFYWVEIRYDDGKTGWSAENWLELAAVNKQSVTPPIDQQPVTKPVDPQPEFPFGDNQQTATSTHTSQIPNGKTQSIQSASSVGPLPGQVKVAISVKDQQSLDAIPGAKVTAYDGNGVSVTVTWTSDGQAFAYGAPGEWKIISSAPGYGKNTAYVPAQTSTSSYAPLTRGVSSDQPATQPEVEPSSSSVGPLPGQVKVAISVKDQQSLDAIPGAKVKAMDGNGDSVTVTWTSDGQAFAYGAPGEWKIISSAPGYGKNTAYVPATTSTSSYAPLTKLPKGGSAPQQVASTSNNGQFTAKFVIPPGGQITGTDGSGNPVQATADSNGYVAIPGSPGSWKITASAPGYETLTINDYKFSGTEVYGGSGHVNLGLQKTKTENQAPEQAFAYFNVQKGGVAGPVLVPGATITVQDGSGKIIKQTVDVEGHATVAGVTGLWQYAITAPGYETQKGYLSLYSGSTTSSIAYLQPNKNGQSDVEPISFAPVQNQVTEKFQVAPGTMITGTDGAGNKIQKTADENGYVTITASPGSWQWTASAPGYVTSGPFSYLFTSDSNMALPQTKDTSNQAAPVSLPQVNPQPDTDPLDQQSVAQAVDQQPVTQPVDQQHLDANPSDQQPVIQPLDQQPVTQPVDPQPDANPLDQQPVIQPLDQQPVTQPVDPQLYANPLDQQPVVLLLDQQIVTQPANPQSVATVDVNTEGTTQITREPVQLSSLDGGFSLEQKPITQPIDPQSTDAIDVNTQGTTQITREPVQLSSLDMATVLKGPVPTDDFTWRGLPYNNSTNGTTQIPSGLPILQPEVSQPTSQTQEGGLSQEQKGDILIDYLESQTQGKDLNEEEANALMNRLDEMQNKLNQQPVAQSEEPAFGDN